VDKIEMIFGRFKAKGIDLSSKSVMNNSVLNNISFSE
jgi:hypothetical protein